MFFYYFCHLKIETVMRFKVAFLFVCLFLVVEYVDAQRWKAKRYEVAVGLGSTHIFGDIGGGADRSNLMGIKDIRLDATRPSLAFNFRYKLSPKFASKFAFTYGYGYGSDDTGPDPWRGYKFNTQILEPSLQMEYYLIAEDTKFGSMAMYYHKGMASNYSRLGIYLFAGVGGAFCLNPKYIPSSAPINPATGQSINTSKEEFKVASMNPVIPGGIGVKLLVNPNMMVGFEFGGRYSFSDLIDGYNFLDSKANKSKDIYYFTTFSLIYRLKNDRYNVPMFLKPLLLKRGGKVRSGPLNPPK
jgi:hypothetical protein